MNSENNMEAEIKDLGLDSPRVTPQMIDDLLAGCIYHISQPEDTTSTIVTAFDANGFSLCTEIMACASPENFNAEVSKRYGLKKCEASARDALWKLEGYRLKRQLMDK